VLKPVLHILLPIVQARGWEAEQKFTGAGQRSNHNYVIIRTQMFGAPLNRERSFA
jgi:hypothetical protein